MAYVEAAREACTQLLAKHDRSSLVLSKYVPSSSLNGWLALRSLAIDTAKIVDNMREYPVALARLQFWKTGIQQLSKQATDKNPATLQLLGYATTTEKANIHKRYLLTLLQTRELQLQQKPVRTIDDLARIGEGSHSQVLYATLDMLQAREPGTNEFLAAHAELDEKVSEIIAHIGQSAGIVAGLRAMAFYAQRQNRVTLPSEVLRAHDLSDQAIINGLEKGELPANMRDAVFEVATAANDHILACRSQLEELRATTGKLPRSLVTTAMAALPIQLYLERLEHNDFDVLKPGREWKLPWRTWRFHRTKRL